MTKITYLGHVVSESGVETDADKINALATWPEPDNVKLSDHFWASPATIGGLLKSRKENPQKLTQLSSRSHPRHLVGKRTAQKDTIIDIASDSQVNSNFTNRWSPARLR